MTVTVTAIPVLPGRIWAASADVGTVSALGRIVLRANGFAFVGQPEDGATKGSARRELKCKAGLEPHLWEMDGFPTLDSVVAYLSEHLQEAGL